MKWTWVAKELRKRCSKEWARVNGSTISIPEDRLDLEELCLQAASEKDHEDWSETMEQGMHKWRVQPELSVEIDGAYISSCTGLERIDPGDGAEYYVIRPDEAGQPEILAAIRPGGNITARQFFLRELFASRGATFGTWLGSLFFASIHVGDSAALDAVREGMLIAIGKARADDLPDNLIDTTEDDRKRFVDEMVWTTTQEPSSQLGLKFDSRSRAERSA